MFDDTYLTTGGILNTRLTQVATSNVTIDTQVDRSLSYSTRPLGVEPQRNVEGHHHKIDLLDARNLEWISSMYWRTLA